MESAERLEDALARMRFAVEAEDFVLLGFPEAPSPADMDSMQPPAQMIVEPGATSMLVRARHAPKILARHAGVEQQVGLRWIRFELPMGWELVGFLARVTSALAAAGVPLGAVCSYHRDHLFVAGPHLEATLEVLGQLFPDGLAEE